MPNSHAGKVVHYAKQAVAVIGLGNMGCCYATRLIAAGFAVTVWNRTPSKATRLAEEGASVAETPAAALRAASIIVAALEHAGAFEATLLSSEALDALSPDHLIVDTSTVLPSAGLDFCKRLKVRGTHYIDAPVSGGTRGAAAGTLTILVGASPEDFARAQPVLGVLGKVHDVGPVTAGHTAKLVNQVIVAGTIGAVSEGLVLAERAGLNTTALLGALAGGFADSRVLREHGKRMIARDFVAGGSNRVFFKDLQAIRELGSSVGLELALIQQLIAGYRALIDAGYAEEDHSSYWRHVTGDTSPRR